MLLIFHVILALLAVVLLARAPQSGRAALGVVACAGADVASGTSPRPALAAALPLLAFLAAALSLAAAAADAGLAERVAATLARRAGGRTGALYALACALCAVVTWTVSLDGAVVLAVPLVTALRSRFGIPFAPFFLGVVTVANAASIAVPQGNPANLVVIQRLHLSPAAFSAHMLLPGVVAAALCAAAVAARARAQLAIRYAPPRAPAGPLSPAERRAGAGIVLAAAAAFAAPAAGVAPWWPFTAAAAVALVASGRRPRVVVPWRVAAQVAGMVVAVEALGLRPPAGGGAALAALLVVALAVGAAAAVANNLPVSASSAALVAGPAGYAATIGLAVGSLATPHGSVATLIAADLAGERAPALRCRSLVQVAAAAVVAATAALWLTL
jgi:arsenical pump membrane protein